jgi:hypothetical protein
MDGYSKRGKFLKRAGLVILMGACAMLTLSSGASATTVSALHGLGTPGGGLAVAMPIASDTVLTHPGQAGTNWNIYGDDSSPNPPVTETLVAAGFTTEKGAPIASLLSPFTNGAQVKGTILSEVYRHTDGHLLFAYTYTNTGTPGVDYGFSTSNIYGSCLACVEVIDAGELQQVSGYTAGMDPRSYSRLSAQPGVIRWYWLAPLSGGALLAPGDTSTTMYIEVDAKNWSLGVSTVQDSGQSKEQIPVLVPGFIPEPLTMLGMFLGLGGVGAYIRKRRMA